jgi:glycosidase
MKGVPMIYDGQEVGCPVKLNYFNNSTPIDWSTNPDMTAEYKKILAFYNGSSVLRNGVLQSYSSDDICVFTKTTGASSVLVAVNLRDTPAVYGVPAVLQGNWSDAFDGSAQAVGATLSLPAYGYKVFKR